MLTTISLSTLALIAFGFFFFRKLLRNLANHAENIIEISATHASDYIATACSSNTAELLETQLKLAKQFNVQANGTPAEFYNRLRTEAFNNLGNNPNNP